MSKLTEERIRAIAREEVMKQLDVMAGEVLDIIHSPIGPSVTWDNDEPEPEPTPRLRIVKDI